MNIYFSISRNGINAIICDQRVTWQDSNHIIKGENTALKCGSLFKGCMYGVAGSMEAAMEYLHFCQKYIKGHQSMGDKTIKEFWLRLLDTMKNVFSLKMKTTIFNFFYLHVIQENQNSIF